MTLFRFPRSVSSFASAPRIGVSLFFLVLVFVFSTASAATTTILSSTDIRTLSPRASVGGSAPEAACVYVRSGTVYIAFANGTYRSLGLASISGADMPVLLYYNNSYRVYKIRTGLYWRVAEYDLSSETLTDLFKGKLGWTFGYLCVAYNPTTNSLLCAVREGLYKNAVTWIEEDDYRDAMGAGNAGFYPTILALSNGTPVLLYGYKTGDGLLLQLAKYLGEEEWSEPRELTIEDTEEALVSSSGAHSFAMAEYQGTLWLAFCEKNNNNLKIVYRSPQTEKWHLAYTIEDKCAYVSITVDSGGHPYIAFRNETDSDYPSICVAYLNSSTSAGIWNVSTWATGQTDPRGHSISVGSANASNHIFLFYANASGLFLADSDSDLPAPDADIWDEFGHTYIWTTGPGEIALFCNMTGYTDPYWRLREVWYEYGSEANTTGFEVATISIDISKNESHAIFFPFTSGGHWSGDVRVYLESGSGSGDWTPRAYYRIWLFPSGYRTLARISFDARYAENETIDYWLHLNESEYRHWFGDMLDYRIEIWSLSRGEQLVWTENVSDVNADFYGYVHRSTGCSIYDTGWPAGRFEARLVAYDKALNVSNCFVIDRETFYAGEDRMLEASLRVTGPDEYGYHHVSYSLTERNLEKLVGVEEYQIVVRDRNSGDIVLSKSVGVAELRRSVPIKIPYGEYLIQIRAETESSSSSGNFSSTTGWLLLAEKAYDYIPTGIVGKALYDSTSGIGLGYGWAKTLFGIIFLLCLVILFSQVGFGSFFGVGAILMAGSVALWLVGWFPNWVGFLFIFAASVLIVSKIFGLGEGGGYGGGGYGRYGGGFY